MATEADQRQGQEVVRTTRQDSLRKTDRLRRLASLDDPYDQAEFDLHRRLDSLFPDEVSLSKASTVLAELDVKILELEKELRQTSQDQLISEEHAQETLIHAQSSLKGLLEEVEKIGRHAEASESMMTDITRDISTLDISKRNLTTSVTLLKRLQMLDQAVSKLQEASTKKDIHAAGPLLQAIDGLLLHFDPYNQITEVADLLDRTQVLKAELQTIVFKLFEESYNSKGQIEGNKRDLKDACVIMDRLDEKARSRLLEWYTKGQLREYCEIFRGNEEVAALDATARRYAWLRRLMKAYEETGQTEIFPSKWKVDQLVCERFCRETHNDLKGVLAKKDTYDISLMLKVLHLTIDFETQLQERFSRKYDPDVEGLDVGEESQEPVSFHGLISSAFEPYLGLYIESKDRTLLEMMDKFKGQPLTDAEARVQVLSSATDLFYFYRETITQAARFSTRQPFWDLTQLLAKRLNTYSDHVLSSRLSQITGPGEDGSSGIKETCYLLNTADYCLTTTGQLETRLEVTIDEEFKERVTLEKQKETYLHFISGSIRHLIALVEGKCEEFLVTMVRLPWDSMTLAEAEPSDYVVNLIDILTEVFAMLRTSITQTKYYKSFCDRFIEVFLRRWLRSIQRTRVYSAPGAEQMMVNTKYLRSKLMELPNARASEPSSPPATYSKLVKRGCSRCEALLRIILVPITPMDKFITTYLSMATDKDQALFQRILEMKGVKWHETQPYVEAFQERTQQIERKGGINPKTRSSLSGSSSPRAPEGGEGGEKKIPVGSPNLSPVKSSTLGSETSTGRDRSQSASSTMVGGGSRYGNIRKLVANMSLRKDPSSSSSSGNG
ncbi:MAG: Vps53-like protein [Piptocephalis tieghemiana]|nr:MAG: Vps53-like protein [Piptocephalis tieghemiana]